MRYKTRYFAFHRIYEMASNVEGGVAHINSFDEVDWLNPKVRECLYKYSKVSLLHHYIYAMVAGYHRYEYKENCIDYDGEEADDLINELEEMFTAYGVKHYSRAEFEAHVLEQYQDSDDILDIDDPFCKWFEYQESNFEQLWEKITDEVFHLLFANRVLLLQFNLSVAQYIKSGRVIIPPKFLDEKGVIKRQGYVPKWLQRAVFYRDQGRCVLCQRDLTGLLGTDRNIHYDHIVPLNLWGINDPCNMQLLCEDCNLKKSGTTAKTDFRYPPWWDY